MSSVSINSTTIKVVEVDAPEMSVKQSNSNLSTVAPDSPPIRQSSPPAMETAGKLAAPEADLVQQVSAPADMEDSKDEHLNVEVVPVRHTSDIPAATGSDAGKKRLRTGRTVTFGEVRCRHVTTHYQKLKIEREKAKKAIEKYIRKQAEKEAAKNGETLTEEQKNAEITDEQMRAMAKRISLKKSKTAKLDGEHSAEKPEESAPKKVSRSKTSGAIGEEKEERKSPRSSTKVESSSTASRQSTTSKSSVESKDKIKRMGTQ